MDAANENKRRTRSSGTVSVGQGQGDAQQPTVDHRLARKWALQALIAAHQMHERNVIHGDIKPHNMLLYGDDLDVKLADFGMALFFDGGVNEQKV